MNRDAVVYLLGCLGACAPAVAWVRTSATWDYAWAESPEESWNAWLLDYLAARHRIAPDSIYDAAVAEARAVVAESGADPARYAVALDTYARWAHADAAGRHALAPSVSSFRTDYGMRVALTQEARDPHYWACRAVRYAINAHTLLAWDSVGTIGGLRAVQAARTRRHDAVRWREGSRRAAKPLVDAGLRALADTHGVDLDAEEFTR